MTRAKSKLGDAEAAQQQARATCELGRSHARAWLQNPCRPLAYLRLEYQDNVLDACAWGAENASAPHVTAAGILDMTAMYNAGLDEALQEFVLLTLNTKMGELQ